MHDCSPAGALPEPGSFLYVHLARIAGLQGQFDPRCYSAFTLTPRYEGRGFGRLQKDKVKKAAREERKEQKRHEKQAAKAGAGSGA